MSASQLEADMALITGGHQDRHARQAIAHLEMSKLDEEPGAFSTSAPSGWFLNCWVAVAPSAPMFSSMQCPRWITVVYEEKQLRILEKSNPVNTEPEWSI